MPRQAQEKKSTRTQILLTTTAKLMLEAIAEAQGISQSSVIELAIRAKAKELGIHVPSQLERNLSEYEEAARLRRAASKESPA